MNSIKNLKDKFDINKIIDFVKKYARYFTAGVLFLILLIILVNFTGSKKTPDETGTEQIQNTESSVPSEETIIQAIVSEELQENAQPTVNELIQNYYTAYAAGDIATLQTLATPISENEQGYIGLYSQYVESYQNMVFYTKPGLDANSYLVNVYIEVKFAGVDTPAPGLDFFYVRTNEDGSLYIDNLYSQYNLRNNENALDTSVQSLIAQYVNGEDVIALLNEVQQKYDSAIAADPNLANMVSVTIPTAISEWAATLVPPSTEEVASETTEAPVEEQPAEEQTEVTEQLLFAGQGMRCRYGWGYRTCTVRLLQSVLGKTPLLSGCKKQHGQFTESEEYKMQTDNRSRQECKSEYAAVKAAGQFSMLCCCIK